ncbi:early nodulin-like protein 2 [Lolium rigidum]|uniref:early nodulin-like protein 2 n=1 Tax=Lolium rigidum TaxID=89674 RepID=UPI001F5C9525|nr:early nodulin-like protein 2 [Lolium rigidum]XP_047076349.1 early nodulin-like protein 2 [Lolium rigidum]
MSKAAGYSLGFACFALVAAMASATQFQVGGNNGWSLAGASAQSYNTWAMKNRFKIGDTLVFVYPKDTDSVLVVQPADYNACNTSSYDKKFADGNTVFTLDRAGAFFFISGVDANCRANEKLIVMVLAGRNGNSSGGAPPSSPAAAPPASSTATPPAAASPAPSASSPPPATVSPPAPAPKAPSPTSAPPPASASAPATPPSSAPAASSPPSAPPSSSPPSPTPSAPAGVPLMPPPATAPAGADGGSTNTTGASPPTGSTNQNSAGFMVTGAAASAAACIVGYAMLAL